LKRYNDIMKNYSANMINQSQTIREALEKLDQLPDTLTLFVIDDNNKLVGTLTDGDIRRGLLKEISLQEPVASFMFQHFRFLSYKKYHLEDLRRIRNLGIRLVPILDDENRIVKIIDFSKRRSSLPVDAVIMAGGKGVRLHPLTLNTPKPLLKVGKKPIIEHNVDWLNTYGIHNLFITLRYLGQQIVDYLGDGQVKDMHIRYYWEKEPLGTLGAVAQIQGFTHEYVLVMNSDILTNIDFEDFFQELVEQDGDMIVATTSFNVKVPYGVIQTDNMLITGLEEKPTYTYYSNAGIYIFKRSIIDWIPKNQPFNSTDLINLLVQKDMKVIHYPILGYWLDIGKPADYEKAQEDIKHIKF